MNANQKPLSDRPLQEVIEEAAREAAEKVRDRNKRMGWPLITSGYLLQQKEPEATKTESASSS